ncbi:MAG: hypothetical protein LBT08_00020 [Synergistaceae bacterium]|nr:hypothetical protein [Synergistaceae bacterium]
MKYLVIGAGGTGGCIAGFMARAGMDGTLPRKTFSLLRCLTEVEVMKKSSTGRKCHHERAKYPCEQ